MMETDHECLTSSEKTISDSCVSYRNLTVSQQLLQEETECLVCGVR